VTRGAWDAGLGARVSTEGLRPACLASSQFPGAVRSCPSPAPRARLPISCAVLTAIMLTSAMNSAAAAEHTFIVAGLGGEPEYEERFREQANAIAGFARKAVGDEHVVALIGAEATRDSVKRGLAELAKRVSAKDAVTIVLIGHGSFDGEEYRFNVPGPDLTATELGELFDALPANEQVIVNATSASGAVIDRWRHPRRVLITATKSGGERTATRFAQHWTQATTTNAADVNKDDLVTAAEAFEYAHRQVEAAFKADVSLATEHARLDGDDADRFAVARFGAARASSGDPEVAALLTQRGALELELNAVRDRKASLAEAAYYDELEVVLVKLALLQRQIDARQAALTGDAG
jgi:hypothetical protein